MAVTHFPFKQTGNLRLLAAVGAIALPSLVLADEPAEATDDGVSLDVSIDFVTAYWFRGIGQENEGIIVQPGATLTFPLFETADGTSISGVVGTWNSFQDSTPGGSFYESDIIAGFSAGLPNGVTVDFTYIDLYNPAGDGIFAEEFDLAVSLDDSEAWGGLGLNPSATLAHEVDGGSDAGGDQGTYLGLSIEPVFEDILGSDSLKVDASIPVTVGLSLDNYYEDAAGHSDTFGYLDLGLVLSTPLDDLIPAGLGSWTASFGVHYLYLGDTAQNISAAFGTGNDDSTVYGTFGLSTSF